MNHFYSFYVFHSVVKNHGFTAASRELHLCQSAISRHVQKCEAMMGGMMLINRTSKLFNITPEGQDLFNAIDQFLNQVAIIKKDGDQPVLSWGILPTWMMGFFDSFLNKITDESIAFNVKIFDGDIIDSATDVYFTSGNPLPEYPEYTCHVLANEKIYIMGPDKLLSDVETLKNKVFQHLMTRSGFWQELFGDVKLHPSRHEHLFMTYQSSVQNRALVWVPTPLVNFVEKTYGLSRQHQDPIQTQYQYGLYIHKRCLSHPEKCKYLKTSVIPKLMRAFRQ